VDRIGKKLVVADEAHHVVGRDDGGSEQPDFTDRAFEAARFDVIARLERPQHDQECARRKVREQTRPRGRNGDPHGRDQRRERRGFHPEIAEDRHDEHHVERHSDDIAEIAQQRGVYAGLRERTCYHAHGEPDQEAAHDPREQRARDLHSESGERRARCRDHGVGVHDGSSR
jgi:hypothetical protein